MPPPIVALLAVVAGLISFTSPCALPLIPSYLSYVSGLPLSELEEGKQSNIVLRSSLTFVAGFTVVFAALGASSTLLGSLLLRNLPTILRVAGVFIIFLGLAQTGLLQVPFLNHERRFDLSRVRQGPKGAFPLGMAFAFGWTPCIGPVLAGILAMASGSRTVVEGALLLVLYSLGLGIPFVMVAMWFSKAKRSLSWLRRHGKAVERTGGILLVLIGVLFVSGQWKTLLVPLQSKFAQLGWPPI